MEHDTLQKLRQDTYFNAFRYQVLSDFDALPNDEWDDILQRVLQQSRQEPTDANN